MRWEGELEEEEQFLGGQPCPADDGALGGGAASDDDDDGGWLGDGGWADGDDDVGHGDWHSQLAGHCAGAGLGPCWGRTCWDA